MTIQKTTDKYIHERTAKTIYSTIKEIRDLLYKIDSPLKEVRLEIDKIFTTMLLEQGMEIAPYMTTTEFMLKEEEETGVKWHEELWAGEKFKQTDLYLKAYSIEFEKFWNEVEKKMDGK